MHSVGILCILLFASSSYTLPLGLHKLVRALNDLKSDLPTVDLDNPVPANEAYYLPDDFGLGFADEWRDGKRSVNDIHDDHIYDTPHKGDPFRSFDPVSSAPAGLIFDDAPPRKRDLFGGIDPGLAHDSTPSLPAGDPKGWISEDATHNKRGEALTEVVDDIIQPVEPVEGSTPDPSSPRPWKGLIFSGAPQKRDEASEARSTEWLSTKDPLLIFKDALSN